MLSQWVCQTVLAGDMRQIMQLSCVALVSKHLDQVVWSPSAQVGVWFVLYSPGLLASVRM